MKAWLDVLLIAASLLVLPAAADSTSAPTDLPATAAVERTLAQHPRVRAAAAEARLAMAERDRLAAGEHEFELGLSSQRRQISGGPDHAEWGASLTRGLRLPGKADLDRRIGEQGVLEAQERLAAIRHETARQLLTDWYAVRQADLAAQLWRQQAELLEAQRRGIESRLRRGDASRLDLLQAEASVAQAEAQWAVARAHSQTARAELDARFPELPPPDATRYQPSIPEGDAALWTQRSLEHNPELRAYARAVEKARLLTRRAEANRRPDPTLGLHVADEMGGADRILGISLSLPLPGGVRAAEERARLAQSEALSESAAEIRRRIAAESAANWQRAAAGVESWQRLDAAAQSIGRQAELTQRAHALGELGLAEALLARRGALDALLAAEQARLGANAAIARLFLDAHRLWPLAGDVMPP